MTISYRHDAELTVDAESKRTGIGTRLVTLSTSV